MNKQFFDLATVMALGYGGAGLLAGLLYGTLQMARHSRAFFSWSCLWRLGIFELLLLGVFLGASLPMLDTGRISLPALFVATVIYAVLAFGLNWLAFYMAHIMARAALE